MSRLTNFLDNITGFSISRKDQFKYIAIDTTKRKSNSWESTEFNYYFQCKNKAQFKNWLKENVAKIDQKDWVLYTKVEEQTK